MTDTRQSREHHIYRINGADYVSKKGAAASLGIKEETLLRMIERGEVTVIKAAGATDGQVTMVALPLSQDPAELADLRAETAPRALPIRAAELEQAPRDIGAVMAEMRAAHRAHVDARA